MVQILIKLDQNCIDDEIFLFGCKKHNWPGDNVPGKHDPLGL
jgi:hypothetical protein